MADKYYVYRPMLDLLGYTEGTDEGRGYNETLSYGAYTGGNVDLVNMTLVKVDALQTQMLAHPKNKWKSSACGRYQIVRTTRRSIESVLGITGTMLFDEEMQDRMACYLLGLRGIDKYLSGRLHEDTLIVSLSQEWASLPKLDGKSYYSNQNARVGVNRVRMALAEVKRRHTEGQPKEVVPIVPVAVEKEVRQKTNVLSGWFGGGGSLAAFGAWLAGGIDYKVLLIVLGVAVLGSAVFLLGGEWIVRRVRSIGDALNEEQSA